jgi:hypothetical protein
VTRGSFGIGKTVQPKETKEDEKSRQERKPILLLAPFSPFFVSLCVSETVVVS